MIKTDDSQYALAGLSTEYSPINYWMWGYMALKKPPPPLEIDSSHPRRGLSTPELPTSI